MCLSERRNAWQCACASARNQFHSGLARNECLSPQFFHHPRAQCYKIGCYKFRTFSIFIYKDNVFMTRGLFMNSDDIVFLYVNSLTHPTNLGRDS